MGRAPCCDKASVKKGPWSPEEDAKLKDYIHKFGTGGNWIALPHKAGLKRCGKSCRLRWLNYLRPNIKHGDFSLEEDRIICSLFATIGSRWSIIAAQLPGRTDNDIKNYWNTKLKKKLMGMATSHSKKAHHDPTTSVTTSSVYHHNHHPFLHRPPPSPALSSTSPYHYYNSPSSTLSFSTLENSISTPTLLPNSTIQDGFFNTNIPIQEQHYHVVKDNNTLLMFGGVNTNTNMNTNIDCDHQQPSCSSSDASNTTTNTSRQIIRSEVIDYDQDHHQGVNLMQNYNPSLNFYNNGQINGQEQEEIKKNISNVDVNEFCSDQSQLLDYGLEEIKQLISINSTHNQSFFFDENKTNEMNNNRILYY